MSKTVEIYNKPYEDVKDFWQDFEEFVFEHKNLIWRGHASSEWKLLSTWHRYLLENEKDFSIDRLKDFIKQFESFLARGGIFPFKEKRKFEEWLMFARHYGLPAPLIDFTYSPYIALFFACCNNAKTNEIVLFALDVISFEEVVVNNFKQDFFNNINMKDFENLGITKKSLKKRIKSPGFSPIIFFRYLVEQMKMLNDEILLRSKIKVNNDAETIALISEIEEIFSKVLRFLNNLNIKNLLFFIPHPRSFNTRMIRQQGCFIYDTQDYKELGVSDLEEHIEKKFPKKESPIMYKWYIPAKFREFILKKLDLMNINGISLYGDEAGAVLDTKLKDDIPFEIADSKIDFDLT